MATLHRAHPVGDATQTNKDAKRLVAVVLLQKHAVNNHPIVVRFEAAHVLGTFVLNDKFVTFLPSNGELEFFYEFQVEVRG